MGAEKYVLAMYDIRGKQEFIYRTRRIKEIMGASCMIRDCFKDHLYPAAMECSPKGIFSYRNEENSDTDFTRQNFEKHLQQGYIGEVVYDGGGNFFVIYRDVEIYRAVNRIFYRRLLEKTGSLRVLTTYIKGVDFNDFRSDRAKLYQKHRTRERQETMLPPVNTLPFVQTDYQTSRPLAEKDTDGNKVSYETARKYEKYRKVFGDDSDDRGIQGERCLDELITQKGTESLLAVVYIDGNNMGAQVQKCIGENPSYESSVKALRKFSRAIQKYYIDDRIEDINRLLGAETDEAKKGKRRRIVVYAGDEITFICNAREAYKVAKEYLTRLAESSDEDTLRTSCAGIAVFHSHAPFADAYRIAEECCDSGKNLMKDLEMTDVSLIDFHYCQGAFGTSLEEIREEESNGDLSRPWFVFCGTEKPECGRTLVRGRYFTDETVQKMQKALAEAGRGNIKGLAECANRSRADFMAELERIIAHHQDKQIDFSLGGELDIEQQRMLIRDMVLVYDLWFKDAKEEKRG